MSDYSHAYSRCQSFIDSNFVPSPPVKKPGPSMTLSISRQAYSRSHAISEKLIGLLQADKQMGNREWALFDRDLVHQILREHNLPERIAKYMPEDREKPVASTINEILGLHPSMWDLFHYTCDTIYKLASIGNVILIGRGAHIVTRDMPNVLRVRIIAPRKLRVNRAAQLLQLSPAEAEKILARTDHAQAAYVQSHFDESIDDPHSYDMVLNTGTLDDEAAARILFHALKAR